LNPKLRVKTVPDFDVHRRLVILVVGFVVFLSPYREVSKQNLKLGHDHFF
jgi:hypothetical protein